MLKNCWGLMEKMKKRKELSEMEIHLNLSFLIPIKGNIGVRILKSFLGITFSDLVSNIRGDIIILPLKEESLRRLKFLLEYILLSGKDLTHTRQIHEAIQLLKLQDPTRQKSIGPARKLPPIKSQSGMIKLFIKGAQN